MMFLVVIIITVGDDRTTDVLTIDDNRDGELLIDGSSSDLGLTYVCSSIISLNFLNIK